MILMKNIIPKKPVMTISEKQAAIRKIFLTMKAVTSTIRMIWDIPVMWATPAIWEIPVAIWVTPKIWEIPVAI